ncbi:adenosylcobinamide amidohydrolase [Xinfangfangia pollutisoli]|uniref:adenosylcobinamide amidohydrolase n=1 Tax=Xinfangfangia pollutisoli TaxID=2865960 RepID=UPI00296F062C|nr:adenosylcobinamide amidohydrolase [Xinfangfangia pollutisoli]
MIGAIRLDRPWLSVRLTQPLRVLSWAPHGSGFRVTDHVLWREVRNADLTPGFDAEAWLAREIPDPEAVGMLTSRDIGTYDRGAARVGDVAAEAVVTLGLSNAEAVGKRLPWHSADYGTINILAVTDAPLTEAAQLEALSIAVQGRTAGVMDLDLPLATGRATGTGTDCLALACPAGAGRYAGLHTEVGEALGAAVRDTVSRAAPGWRDAARAARTAGQNAGQE